MTSTKNYCPLIKKKCIESGCKFWVHLLGDNPQTDAKVDQWDCAVSWLPILLIENANMTRQARASVDKVATETKNVRDFFVEAVGRTQIERDLNGKPLLESK